MKDAAYIVMVLHAAKYASSSVTGLLLGHEQEEHGDDANTTTANDIQKTIIIDEALPLAHSDTTHFTTALAQIALMLAEQRATTMRQSSHATHNKHKLVGVYYASAIPGDPGIPTPPTRIADRIRQLHCTDAVLLHLDEERLRPSVRTQKHCARVRAKRNLSSSGVIGRIPSDQKKQPKQQKDGPWGRATLPDQALRVSQSALGMTHYLLASPPKKDVPISPYDVVDFEDHCTDPRYDWLNGQVVAKVPFDVPET